jgi:hypothetical protein
MTTAPISAPYNLHAGARGTAGRAPEPKRRPTLDAEAATLLATLPDPLTEDALTGFCLRQVEHPTRSGARTLAYLSEIGREAAPAAADYLALLSKAVAAAVARHDAFVSLGAAMKDSLMEALELGRRLGRQELAEELAADSTRPVLERRVEFLSDDKGRITGKIEREFKPGGKEK